MMATTLREIAPQCEIYAINGVYFSENGNENRIDYLEKSIEWAIQNKIDILTYSHAAFFGDERIRANKAVEKAVSSGMITTFIHNDKDKLWRKDNEWITHLHLPSVKNYCEKQAIKLQDKVKNGMKLTIAIMSLILVNWCNQYENRKTRNNHYCVFLIFVRI